MMLDPTIARIIPIMKMSFDIPSELVALDNLSSPYLPVQSTFPIGCIKDFMNFLQSSGTGQPCMSFWQEESLHYAVSLCFFVLGVNEPQLFL